MKANILSLHTHLKVTFFFVSESAYKKRERGVDHNRAKSLTLHTPLTSGVGLKGQIL